MSLKSEAKAAEQALRNFFRPGAKEQAHIATMSKYAGELKATLQMAQMDVTRLSNEVGGAKARAISAETKMEGLEHELESLKQQITSIELNQQLAKERQAAEELHRVALPNFAYIAKVGGDTTMADAVPKLTYAQRRGWMIWPVLAGVGTYHRWLADDVDWLTRCHAYGELFGYRVLFEDLYDICCLTSFHSNAVMPFHSPSSQTPPADTPLPPILSPIKPVVSLITNRDAPFQHWRGKDHTTRSILLNPLLHGQGFSSTDPTKLRDRREAWAVTCATSAYGGLRHTLANILFLLRATLDYATETLKNERITAQDLYNSLVFPRLTLTHLFDQDESKDIFDIVTTVSESAKQSSTVSR